MKKCIRCQVVIGKKLRPGGPGGRCGLGAGPAPSPAPAALTPPSRARRRHRGGERGPGARPAATAGGGAAEPLPADGGAHHLPHLHRQPHPPRVPVRPRRVRDLRRRAQRLPHLPPARPRPHPDLRVAAPLSLPSHVPPPPRRAVPFPVFYKKIHGLCRVVPAWGRGWGLRCPGPLGPRPAGRWCPHSASRPAALLPHPRLSSLTPPPPRAQPPPRPAHPAPPWALGSTLLPRRRPLGQKQPPGLGTGHLPRPWPASEKGWGSEAPVHPAGGLPETRGGAPPLAFPSGEGGGHRLGQGKTRLLLCAVGSWFSREWGGEVSVLGQGPCRVSGWGGSAHLATKRGRCAGRASGARFPRTTLNAPLEPQGCSPGTWQ